MNIVRMAILLSFAICSSSTQEKQHETEKNIDESRRKLLSNLRGKNVSKDNTVMDKLNHRQIELPVSLSDSLSKKSLRGEMKDNTSIEETVSIESVSSQQEQPSWPSSPSSSPKKTSLRGEIKEETIIGEETIIKENSILIEDSIPMSSVGLILEATEAGNVVDYGDYQPTINYELFRDDIGNWKPIRISFEILKSSFSSNNDESFINSIQEILPSISKVWSEQLSVIPVKGNLYASSTTCGNSDVPIRNLSDGLPNSDTVIYISARDDQYCKINNSYGSIESYTSLCNLDQHHRPIFGNISLCTSSLQRNSKSLQDRLRPILIHEVGRILGLSPTLFQFYRDPETGSPYGSQLKSVQCVDGSKLTLDVPNMLQEGYHVNGRRHFEVATSTVLQVVRNHFNCQMLSGARLDNSPLSESCFGGSGWDERFFYQENMSSLNKISLFKNEYKVTPLSLALLEDSSWYRANYKNSHSPSFGHGAGCGFVEGNCLVNNKVPSYSKDFFCSIEKHTQNDDALVPLSEENIAISSQSFGCDVNHLAKAQCDETQSSSSIIDDNIFELMKYRGLQSFLEQQYLPLMVNDDICPMRTKNSISCLDVTQTSQQRGEIFSPNSRCLNTSTSSSICLESRCNSGSHKVEIIFEKQLITCKYSGEMIEIKTNQDKTISIECPKFEIICPNLVCPSNCSGKGMCDYSMNVPVCICDDPMDETEGCWAKGQ